VFETRTISLFSLMEPGFLVGVLLLWVGGSLLYLVADSSSAIGKAVASLLLPVDIGLAGALLAQVVFNVLSPDVASVRAVENWMGYAYSRAKDWLALRFVTYVCIILILTLLASFLPRWRPVSRFLALRKWLSTAIAALGCMTSFTFFSQYPYRWQESEEKQRVELRFRSHEEKETRDKLNLVTVEAMKRSLPELSAAQKSYYRDLAEAIDHEVRWGQQERVIESLLEDQTKQLPEPPLIEADVAPIKAGEFDKAAESVFCEAIGALTPKLAGVAGKVAKGLVGVISKKLFDAGKNASGGRIENPVARGIGWFRQVYARRVDDKRSGSATNETRTATDRLRERDHAVEPRIIDWLRDRIRSRDHDEER